MSITIRPETETDFDAIDHVNRQAFAPSHQEAALVRLLRKNGKVSLSLVAEYGAGQVVGHILFSPVTIGEPPSPVRAVGLGPVAVLPEYQNQGIGAMLCRVGLEACRKSGEEIAVVLGHSNYYPRFGFVQADQHNLYCEWDVPPEAFMVMALQPGALETVQGLVRYQPEFNEAT